MKQSMQKLRACAISSTRCVVRKRGEDPKNTDAETAYTILDEYATNNPNTSAAEWHRRATDAQYKVFLREWRTWRASVGSPETCPACKGLGTLWTKNHWSFTHGLEQESVCIVCKGKGKWLPRTKTVTVVRKGIYN